MKDFSIGKRFFYKIFRQNEIRFFTAAGLLFFLLSGPFSVSGQKQVPVPDSVELFSFNAAAVRDSLLERLRSCPDLHEQLSIYRNLADLPVTQDTYSYRCALFRKAMEAGDIDVMTDVLNEMTAAIVRGKDSVGFYLNLLEKYPGDQRIKGAVLYIKMLEAVNSSYKKEKREYIDSLIRGYKKDSVLASDIYDQILYLTIMGHYTVGNNQEEGAFYLKKALELAETLPPENRYIAVDLKVRLSNLYLYITGKDEEANRYLAELIDYSRNKLQEYRKAGRKFKNYDNFYYITYAKIIFNYKALSREDARYYLEKIRELTDRYPQYEKTYVKSYLLKVRSRMAMGDYRGALSEINRICADTSRPLPIEDRLLLAADIVYAFQMTGDYRSAFKAQQNWIDLYKSYLSVTMGKGISEYQALYDVAHLKNEKTRLELDKQNLLIKSYLILILLLISWSIYQYVTLRKVRRLKSEVEQQSEKAKESECMKAAFINNMCHEIRTPLNAINGFSELLGDRTLDAAIRSEYINIIRENVTILVSLMTDLLEVSNLDTLSNLKKERTDVAKICRNCLEEFKRSHPFNGELQYIMEAGAGECLSETNGRYLSRVLECVLSNAYKFTERGSVTVSCRTEPEYSQVRISVTDTGSGIPSGKEEKVFERFVKLEEFKTGNGLGLYISRLIITLLGGRIFVDPHYKSGTRIIILLPVN